MGKYILKRLVYIVIVFFIVSLLMYALYNLIPGDPAMVEMEPLRKVLKPAASVSGKTSRIGIG